MIQKITGNPIKALYDTQKAEMLGQVESTGSFGEMLKGSMDKLNQSQLDADSAINGFLKGDITDVHSVMIALQKADMNLRLALQVRSKVIQAYEEIVRMQI